MRKGIFNVGDKVMIRPWDDMAAEFATRQGSLYISSVYFLPSMRYLCMEQATITNVFDTEIELEFDKDIDGNWTFTEDMLIMVKSKQDYYDKTVICVDDGGIHGLFKVGKAYRVIEGILRDEKGNKSVYKSTNLQELNYQYMASFIEMVY